MGKSFAGDEFEELRKALRHLQATVVFALLRYVVWARRIWRRWKGKNDGRDH